MANRRTSARPYAKAIYAEAEATRSFAAWSAMLATLSAVMATPEIGKLEGDPRIPHDELGDIIIAACGTALDPKGKNLVHYLAHTQRLALCPEIASLYEERCAEKEGRIDLEVLSAHPIDEQTQKKLAACMQKKLSRETRLQVSVVPTLLGGVVMRARDHVTNLSVVGALARLTQQLKQ